MLELVEACFGLLCNRGDCCQLIVDEGTNMKGCFFVVIWETALLKGLVWSEYSVPNRHGLSWGD
jgi:hypothetical protein